MALSVTQTAALDLLLKSGMKVCSFGYPDIIAHIEMEGLEYREDSEAICRRHGLKLHPIPDAHSYFKLKGCELDVYDIVKERGCEILIDLNLPFDGNTGNEFHKHTGLSPLWESYDIVLDVGTVEHCFNIGQAMFNMAGVVKDGGYIIHENPFNNGNHGFYNLNPTFYSDFYEQNGFKVLECKLVDKQGNSADVPHTKRFKYEGKEVNTFCFAQRVKMQSFVYPQQSKYKIPDAGARANKE